MTVFEEIQGAGLAHVPCSIGADGSVTIGEGVPAADAQAVRELVAARAVRGEPMLGLGELADARAAKQAQIRDLADQFLAPHRAEYGVVEMATWDQQFAEAQALQADAQADAPLVRAIASARGMDVAELASRIVSNRAAWMVLSGHVIGQRLAYQDALDAAYAGEDVEAMLAIEPVYTLPGV